MMSGQLGMTSLATAIDRLEVGIILLDAESRILGINRWLVRHAGQPDECARGHRLDEVFPAAGGSRLAQAVDHAIRDNLPSLLSPALHGTLLPLFRTPDDRRQQRRMHQMIHVMPLTDAAQPAACLIQISDMSPNISRERLLRRQTESLRRSTTHDLLTGVANRRRFDETLSFEFQQAQADRKWLALIIVDLDFFAEFNARHGRPSGDQALVDIARTLKANMRQPGDLLARYNGAEFALILPGMGESETCQLAATLRREVCQLAIANEAAPESKLLTASIGAAAIMPGPDADTHTLLSSAEMALYQARHEGRNRAIHFSAEEGSFRHCA